MTSLVTFDFHNTIANCDTWFFLEIRDLPVCTLGILAPEALERFTGEEITATYRALRRAVMEHGREIDAVGGVMQVASTLGIHLHRDDVDETIRDLMHAASEEATAIAGAVESIRAIANRGIAVGIVSSAVYHPFLEWTLERFGIADALSFVMTSASSGYYKSDPEIYHAAMRIVDSHADHSIHVGDSERWDVWSAKEAGMRAVWFQNGHVDTLVDRPFEVVPDHVVTSMADVAPWVLENLERDR